MTFNKKLSFYLIFGSILIIFSSIAPSKTIYPGSKFFANTTIYDLVIQEYSLDYDHFAISYEDEKSIKFIAVKGWGIPEGDFTPLKIDQITMNKYQDSIKQKTIHAINDNIRVLDVHVTPANRIFVSYVTRNNDFQFAIKVVEVLNNKDKVYLNNFFTTDFESSPLSIVEGGGKIISIENDIFLSVGDFGKKHEAMNNKSQLGKILKISLNSENVIQYSKGHRNPQGLIYSHIYSKIFATEHGEFGGDEINHILFHENYGWPDESFGVPYDHHKKKINTTRIVGLHYGFKKPVYAFLPDIGIKSIEQLPLNQSKFPLWENNFILCSSKGIFRVNITNADEPRVIFTELLNIFSNPQKNKGCRDLAISNEGTIITNNFMIIKNAN